MRSGTNVARGKNGQARLHTKLQPHLDENTDPDIDPSLASCAQLSLQTSLRSLAACNPATPLAVAAFGMNLHADSLFDGRDRKRLERVARYLLRPPFALESVEWLDSGRVRLHMPRRGNWVDMTPEQFLAKLAALVPPPRLNMLRYAGVFASHHRLRPAIVPRAAATRPAPPQQLDLFNVHQATSSQPRPTASPRAKRMSWARLLARVFQIDIEQCPRCSGRLRITEVVTDPDKIALLLDGARAPPRRSPPGQIRLPLESQQP